MWNEKLESHARHMRTINGAIARGERVSRYASPKTRVALAAAAKLFSSSRIPKAKAAGIYYPAKCPRCSGKHIGRKGSTRGIQRYVCRGCKRNFSDTATGGRPILELKPKLMCYRCGEFNTKNGGKRKKGGNSGYCLTCNKYFMQGGRTDFERNQITLRQRVDLLKLPKDVALELLQQAVADVLEGKGYCVAVELNVQQAWDAARGDKWSGSGSSIYCKAVGDESEY